MNLNLLVSSAASLLVVRKLFVLVNRTDLSEVVEPLDLLSDSIDLFWGVPFDSALLRAIMKNYDTLIKGFKV